MIARPGKKTVAERTWKRTNANEIIDGEWILVRERLAYMREFLTHVQVSGAQKSENEEITERYVMPCEKAIENGKREHLPKILQRKLDKQKCDMQENGRAKENSPRKPAETAVPTSPVTTTSAATSTMAVASTKGKEEGGDQKTQNLQKRNVDEVFAIGLDVDSNSDLVFDSPADNS